MENDLIRRSDAVDMFKRLSYDDWNQGAGTTWANAFSECEELINMLPAVDAVEVVHGHWITEQEAMEKDDYLLRDTCSVCGHCDWDCTESEGFNYCPFCGAKMDGRIEDGDNGKHL